MNLSEAERINLKELIELVLEGDTAQARRVVRWARIPLRALLLREVLLKLNGAPAEELG